ncbi:hypothetical protein HanIR_Chr13g0666101 [Helianthus annuus]|nr:hypothetical protein HanIR_Chr13g0666101 [Helianthus annuus]
MKMRTGRQQVTLRDLVDEAKKRNVFLFVCSVGLSYLMSCKFFVLELCSENVLIWNCVQKLSLVVQIFWIYVCSYIQGCRLYGWYVENLTSHEKKGLKLIDSPLSCGVKRASEGSLTARKLWNHVQMKLLSMLVQFFQKLYVIKGGCGAAVHIAYAAEAMALIWSSIGIGYKNLFLSTKDGEGTSWGRVEEYSFADMNGFRGEWSSYAPTFISM